MLVLNKIGKGRRQRSTAWMLFGNIRKPSASRSEEEITVFLIPKSSGVPRTHCIGPTKMKTREAQSLRQFCEELNSYSHG